MTPVYPVRVVLDSDQHRVPLVAAKSREEARVRALGLGFGNRRVARVEQEEAGMTSKLAALLSNRQMPDNSTLTVTLGELRAAFVPKEVRLSPDGDLRAAAEYALRAMRQQGWHENGAPVMGTAEAKLRAALAAAPATPPQDAQRYQRLRVLGAAPYGSPQLDNATVLRFTGLDDFVDADLRRHSSRGEAAPATPPRVTHGRHCRCSSCARYDWTDPSLAPCGMHGPSCPPVYAPIAAPATPPTLDDVTDWNRKLARFTDAEFDDALARLAPAAPPTLDAGLDVERLARAMRWAGVRSEPDFATIEEAARQVASDYDALPKFGYVARLSGDQP